MVYIIDYSELSVIVCDPLNGSLSAGVVLVLEEDDVELAAVMGVVSAGLEEEVLCSCILPIAYWSCLASLFTVSAACLNRRRKATSTSTEKTNNVEPSQLTSNAYSATR